MNASDSGMRQLLLPGLPITKLTLDGSITGKGLKALQGMPITELWVLKREGDTDDGLAALRGLPIKKLRLCHFNPVLSESRSAFICCSESGREESLLAISSWATVPWRKTTRRFTDPNAVFA